MATQKELEKRIAELERQVEERTTEVKRLYDLNMDMLGTASFDGYFKTLNPVWETTLGYTIEELISKPFIEFVHPDDVSATNTEVAKLVQGAKSISFENRYRCKDGSYKWLSWTTVPDMKAQTLYFIARDNTRQKEAEEELAYTKTLMEAVFEQSPIPMVVATVPDMVIRIGNPAALKFLGIEDEESHIGESLFEFEQTWQDFDVNGNPVTMADLPLAKAMQGIETRNAEYMVKRKDGSIGWEVVDGVPIYNKERQLIAGLIIFPDITERKQGEAERERLQQEIIETQQRAIAELSTPVIPIMDRIIVMPLVGSIDSMRARDITRSLLAGVSQHRAKVVILDVTGVGIMDTGIVNHLNKTIQAARLKGARTIVTGISDAVAEAIVDLGIDWSKITTLSDLQTGLITALDSLGVRLTK
jgi:rsbT co-antagonist protein RsbR